MATYPDIAAYHCIAVTLGQAGYIKELFDVIGPLPKTSSKLNCLQSGIQDSNWMYNALLKCLCWSRSCWPAAILVNALWKEGKVDEAIHVFNFVVGTAGLYYDLARCLCSAGSLARATFYAITVSDLTTLVLFPHFRFGSFLHIDKICRVANKPLVVTYTGLMQACAESGNKLLIENAHRFPDQALHQLVRDGSILLHRSENPALEHLLDSCKDFLRKQTLIDVKQVEVGTRFQDNAALVC
ncbi:hypothetical protein SASPL_141984 [Salvia splendens]|uniref:Pentatricopeptide repeat-containing protein n=1 Tax=Salvia splendens TaxID=180675 RepID=A0A8X8WK57_SALSN|nr:hypothetical protein SASPL_141984 [Salvia splendens]